MEERPINGTSDQIKLATISKSAIACYISKQRQPLPATITLLVWYLLTAENELLFIEKRIPRSMKKNDDGKRNEKSTLLLNSLSLSFFCFKKTCSPKKGSKDPMK